MKQGKKETLNVSVKSREEKIISDLELGIMESEVYTGAINKPIELIQFNRLQMILELNNKVNAN